MSGAGPAGRRLLPRLVSREVTADSGSVIGLSSVLSSQTGRASRAATASGNVTAMVLGPSSQNSDSAIAHLRHQKAPPELGHQVGSAHVHDLRRDGDADHQRARVAQKVGDEPPGGRQSLA